MKRALLALAILAACAPQPAAPSPQAGPRERLAVASIASALPAGTLERIVAEELEANPTLRARLEVIPADRLREALGGPAPQQWNAGLYERLERGASVTLFLSGAVALGENARQARFRLARRDGPVGTFEGETTTVLGLIPYRQPAQPEDAREVIRLAFQRMAAGLGAAR